MSEIRYRIPIEDRIAFEQRFHADFAGSWMPTRLILAIRLTTVLGFGLLVFSAIPEPERAVPVFGLGWLLLWASQTAINRVVGRGYRKFLQGLPGAEDFTTFFDGDYIVTESRGSRIGFHLSTSSSLYSDSDYVYVDFNKLGRVRVPISAFPDDAARSCFESRIRQHTKQNEA